MKIPELRRQQRPRSLRGRFFTALVFLLAGLLMSLSMITARGTDLRSDRNLSLRDLIREQGVVNTELQQEVERVRAEVNSLSGQDLGSGEMSREISEAELQASLSPVSGPGFRVTLTDAPADVKPAGVSDDALVVHQQDIQAVVNALWAGGAEAMTIQGQRVISTTGIKCVGNSVVLHGVPYAPPYVIEAIGDPAALQAAVESSEEITVYREYVQAYGLGYAQQALDNIDMPAFSGSTGIAVARQR